MAIFQTYVELQEIVNPIKRPIKYHKAIIFLWFSYGFSHGKEPLSHLYPMCINGHGRRACRLFEAPLHPRPFHLKRRTWETYEQVYLYQVC